MSKHWLACLLVSLVCASCSSTSHPRATTQPTPIVDPSTSNGLHLTIALLDPELPPQPNDLSAMYRYARGISIAKEEHFPVVLTNVSDSDIHVVQEANSWGDGALHFEFVDDHGATYTLEKGPGIWHANYLSFWNLHAGDSLVLDVYFGGERGDWPLWTGLPDLKSNNLYGTLTAYFDFDTAKTHGPNPTTLWTGHLQSRPVRCFLTLGR